MLALIAGPLAWSAEPSIRVRDSGITDGFRAMIDRAAARIADDAALAAQGRRDGPAIYFNPSRPLDQVPDFESLSLADQAFLRASKRTYDLYRTLGGDTIDKFAVVQRRDNRFYLGFDGEGGRWLATPRQALSHMLTELIQGSELPSEVKQAVSRCSNDFGCMMSATFTGLLAVAAAAPRGATVTFELTGEGFRAGGGPPMVWVPEGFVVREVTVIDAERIAVRISIGAAAALGRNTLDVFNQGAAFRAVARYDVIVLDGAPPGGAAAPDVTDDIGGEPATAATLAAEMQGRLETANDVDLFKIVVEQAGTLAVTSAGPTDVLAVLEAADGSVVGGDDDSGQWYNFAFSQTLAPGTYYLRVTHCCAGTGNYRLSTTFSPN